MITVEINSEILKFQTRVELENYLEDQNLRLKEDGTIVKVENGGVIPSILNKWFSERIIYKDLMKKYVNEGNKELADFYDRRQHVQKILLNSIYGVLGLAIFRFYDIDNALAVTATGQDVIKTTAKYINAHYRKQGVLPKTEEWMAEYRKTLIKAKQDPTQANENDHCVYIDTDSVYFSAADLFNDEVTDPKTVTIKIAQEMEAGVNKFYDAMAKMLFNCDTHRFVIKGESVIETGLWVGKKRYVMKKVYDLETNQDKLKIVPKGLDVVRSSFPPAFSKFTSAVMLSILNKEPRAVLDKMILNFYSEMKTMSYMSLARNTSVNKVSEYDDPSETSATNFPKGAPAQSKAAVSYNRLIRSLGLQNKYPLIADGAKIKYVYLKKNPYNLETIAFKTYDDPPQVLELIEEYLDYNKLFEKELSNKLERFYEAMRWGMLPTSVNQNALEFFSFD